MEKGNLNNSSEPTDDVTSIEAGQRLYDKAMSHLESGEVPEAEKLLLESLAISRDASACRRLAEIALENGRKSAADRYIAMAFSLNPRNDKGALEYSETLIRSGELQRAMSVLKMIVERNPHYRPAETLLTKLQQATQND